MFIHTADPQEFFQPIDYHNERWLELSLFARSPLSGRASIPRFEELMTERDNLFRKHPKTTFVAAHMGWHANDLARLGKMLDEMPNVYTEVGAVLYDIGRQPRAAHDFFVKYQDRILFGKDSFQPEEYPYYWRVFETQRRVLRLLPRLSRVLEAVRHRSAGRGAEEGVLPERAEDHAAAAADRLAALESRVQVPSIPLELRPASRTLAAADQGRTGLAAPACRRRDRSSPQDQQRHGQRRRANRERRAAGPCQHHADLVPERIVVDQVGPGRRGPLQTGPR